VGKEKSRFRVFTKKQREKFFEVYRNAAIYPHTGLPSVNEVAHKCKLAHKTVKRLRDENGWEARRLKIIAEAEAELDKKRVASTVSKVSIIENLVKAGLNALMGRLYETIDSNGNKRTMLDLSYCP
jgi:DNA-binding transcriptional regulator YhcF (GntR family)